MTHPGRILGVETEYALVAAHTQPQAPGTPNPLSTTEALNELFAGTPLAAVSRNRFLPNGGRLYVDIGQHPEYASAESRSLTDLVANDRAGEQIWQNLADTANARLTAAGRPIRLHLIKNNIDSAGTTFGCHENYALPRAQAETISTDPGFITFLVLRPLLTGSGWLQGPKFYLSARAPLVACVRSLDPTHDRPLINAREEALADPGRYCRLQVTFADSSICETTTALKFGLTTSVLTALETGVDLRAYTLTDPIAALHSLNSDRWGDTALKLASGRRAPAREILAEILHLVARTVGEENHGELGRLFNLATRTLAALANKDLRPISTEIDWACKFTLLENYAARCPGGWEDPRLPRLELAYHDLSPLTGLAEKLRREGLQARWVSPDAVAAAQNIAPTDTRAHVRGKFVTAVEQAGRPASIGWTHLRLDRPPQPQIDLPDPLAAKNEAVDQLLERLQSGEL